MVLADFEENRYSWQSTIRAQFDTDVESPPLFAITSCYCDIESTSKIQITMALCYCDIGSEVAVSFDLHCVKVGVVFEII